MKTHSQPFTWLTERHTSEASTDVEVRVRSRTLRINYRNIGSSYAPPLIFFALSSY